MTPSVLVTGGAGFIGSHVVERFLADGFDVTVLDDLSSGKRENVPGGVPLHVLDVGAPEAAGLVREGGFDVICHLAAQMDVRRSVADPVFDARVNVVGSLNLLEAVRASGRATRLVFASTGGAVYGDLSEPPTPEKAPKDPESPYGIAKLSVEYYLGYYGRLHGLDCVALRFANVYGPRQDPHGEAGVVAIFCGRILAGEPLTVFGDGLQTRDYVFVGDVARANVLAATRPLPPVGRVDERAFNIGTGTETSVLHLAAVLQRAAGADVGTRHAPARPGEQRRSAVDPTRAHHVFGWRAERTLEDGLASTFEYFAERAGRVVK